MGTLSAPCPHCRHDKSIFNVVWSERAAAPQSWHTYLNCVHCHRGIGALLKFVPRPNTADGGPHGWQGDISNSYVLEQAWPVTRPLSAPDHTPSAVGKRFIEGEDAYSRRNWNSAVGMYRSALDIATKSMDGVPKLSFFERLKWMHENGKITTDIKNWADHVRIEGNDALHDPEEFNQEDATSLRFFTEMFLRYVFELPGKVAEFRARVAEPAKA